MIQIPIEPQITEYLHAKAAKNHIPISGTFELLPVCNMSCRMCYVRMTREEQEAIKPLYSADDWLELAEKLKDKGMVYLLLTGGEPFLYPEIRRLLEELQKMGLIISINSNGTLIDESVLVWLKENPPSRVNITLYGASDETYERLCGNPRGFSQVTKAIHLLKEAGITVKLNCSVTPYNVGDLEEIFAFATEEHLIIQATSYMFPPMRRDVSMIGKNDRFSPEKAAYYAAKIEMLLNGSERFLERMEKQEYLRLNSESSEDCSLPASAISAHSDGEGLPMQCRAGKCSFWVAWDGTCMPCGMIPSKEPLNVFEKSFDEIWKQTMKQAEEIRLPIECKLCPVLDQCRPCAAMVMTESGDYHRIPEYRCEMTRAYPAACRKLEQEIREAVK